MANKPNIFANEINFENDEALLDQFQNSEIEAGYDDEKNQWEVIVKYNGNVLKLEQELGVEVEVLSNNYAIVTLDADKVPLLYANPRIEYIERPRLLSFSLKESLSISCITAVQSENGFGLEGNGTVIGILDSGIDYTHPDFRNEDGTTRILFLWDQSGKGSPPEGFKNGVEYSAEQLNEALINPEPFTIVPEMDEIGHGTAVAGVAAGNGRSSQGVNRGVAPKAGLIIVKLGEKGRKSFARTTELMRAIKYAVSKAEALEMPLAVNISYGTNDGSHDGSSLFETYIDEISQRWKTSIVVASGNEGSGGHHFAGKVEQGETLDVPFFTSSGNTAMFISIWTNFVDTLSFELFAPNGKSTGEIFYTDATKIVNINDTYVLVNYGQPSHYNEDQGIFFQLKAAERYIPEGIWTMRVKGQDVVDGRINMWLPSVEQVSNKTAFSRPSVNTTLTIPSTAENVVTVGGFNQLSNTIADFSGRGYTRNNIYIKPDLVAPAVDVLTTRRGGGYDRASGTSIAAPFVTGSAALMMEWGIVNKNDTFLYGQRIKAFLKVGTNKKDNIDYPNPSWGYGSLCLKRTMDYLKEYADSTDKPKTLVGFRHEQRVNEQHYEKPKDTKGIKHGLHWLLMLILCKTMR